MDAEIGELNAAYLGRVVETALSEDIGTGDVTTLATVPSSSMAQGRIIAQEAGVLAGVPVVREVYRQIDPSAAVRPNLADGDSFKAGDVIVTVQGPARAILTGERVALNFLQRMCGIATVTRQFTERVADIKVRIVDTRKTTPGLRALEKYSVKCGGGHNHRMGLYDAIMIKDNHIVAAGGITGAVRLARKSAPHTVTITVECETLAHVDEALLAGADILLLDHMDISSLTEAVKRTEGQALTEASGNVTLDRVDEIAKTGVDIISIGALTHSARAIDISLDLVEPVS